MPAIAPKSMPSSFTLLILFVAGLVALAGGLPAASTFTASPVGNRHSPGKPERSGVRMSLLLGPSWVDQTLKRDWWT